MKLKYYLRGIGIGVIVTALIMGIALPSKFTPSDEEIIARAEELGMKMENRTLSDGYGTAPSQVYNGDETVTPADDGHPNIIVPTEAVLPDGAAAPEITPEGASQITGLVTKEPTPEPTDEPTPEPTDEPTPVPTAEPTPEPTPVPTEKPAPEPTVSPVAASSDTVYIVTVKKGDSSGSVCKRMQEAGIIESAKEFDKYLCDKGYDTRLSFGDHEIPEGSSFEDMALILMNKK